MFSIIANPFSLPFLIRARDKDQKILVRAGNEPDVTHRGHLAETTRPTWLLLVSWYFGFYLTLYSLRWNQTLK
jgi:hypothetical protein